ncbi:MAG: TrkA family potassium uptake protein [Peptococcaceae bacterium]|nr:TrkA family potassium uptake protein [Peptococcaceae bacterium]
MTKKYLVIGAGRFGSSVAKTLFELGHEVVVVDKDVARVQQMSELVTKAVQADATSEGGLNSLGMGEFDVAIVAIGGDIQASIMASILLIEAGARYIVANAQTEMHGKTLAKIGVNRIVFPQRDMGQKLAHSLSAFNIVDLVELSSGSNVVEVIAPAEMVGRTLEELKFRALYGINVIALRGKDGTTNISPGAEDKIGEGDLIIAVGEYKALRKLGWV